MPISESEVFEEVLEEGNIQPDEFGSVWSELASGGAGEVSTRAAQCIFKAGGYECPEVVLATIDELDKMQILVAGGAEEKARVLISYMQALNSLYVYFSAEYSRLYAQAYPISIKHGETKRAEIDTEAKTAHLRSIKNYLRNLFFIVSKASSVTQSLMKAELQDRMQ
jgi:hypothetical protein